MTPNQPVPEVKVGVGEGERGDNVDDHASTNGSLNAIKEKANSAMILPPACRAHHLMVALASTCIAKITETS